MDFIEPEIRDILMQEHVEFRRLLEEHRAADERLLCLRGRPSMSPRESVEAVELKKAKLRAKERIYRIVRDYNKSKGR